MNLKIYWELHQSITVAVMCVHLRTHTDANRHMYQNFTVINFRAIYNGRSKTRSASSPKELVYLYLAKKTKSYIASEVNYINSLLTVNFGSLI